MFFKKQPAAEQAPEAATAAAPPAAPPPAGQQPAMLDPDEAKRRAAAAKQAAASFGEIVSLLMRSPTEKTHTLQDLEWLVAPAIVTGQFAVADAQSRETGAVMPVGAVLWANVSPEIDQQLSSNLDAPPRLRPQDWRSGDIPWIIMSIGDSRVVGGLLQQLSKSLFKDRPAKIRAKGADGKIVVGRLEIGPPQAQ